MAKTIFNEDGSTEIVVNNPALETTAASHSSQQQPSYSCFVNAKVGKKSRLGKRVLEFKKKVLVEERYLQEKFGGDKKAKDKNHLVPGEKGDEIVSPLNGENATLNLDGSGGEKTLNETIVEKKITRTLKKNRKRRKRSAAAAAVKKDILGLGSDPTVMPKETDKMNEKIEPETPKTLAIQYLLKFINDKPNWKFQKIRQIWLLRNMYFSHQMDNETFAKCILYLKGLSDRQKLTLVQEAKDVLANDGLGGLAVSESVSDFNADSETAINTKLNSLNSDQSNSGSNTNTNSDANANANDGTFILSDTTKKRAKLQDSGAEIFHDKIENSDISELSPLTRTLTSDLQVLKTNMNTNYQQEQGLININYQEVSATNNNSNGLVNSTLKTMRETDIVKQEQEQEQDKEQEQEQEQEQKENDLEFQMIRESSDPIPTFPTCLSSLPAHHLAAIKNNKSAASVVSDDPRAVRAGKRTSFILQKHNSQSQYENFGASIKNEIEEAYDSSAPLDSVKTAINTLGRKLSQANINANILAASKSSLQGPTKSSGNIKTSYGNISRKTSVNNVNSNEMIASRKSSAQNINSSRKNSAQNVQFSLSRRTSAQSIVAANVEPAAISRKPTINGSMPNIIAFRRVSMQSVNNSDKSVSSLGLGEGTNFDDVIPEFDIADIKSAISDHVIPQFDLVDLKSGIPDHVPVSLNDLPVNLNGLKLGGGLGLRLETAQNLGLIEPPLPNPEQQAQSSKTDDPITPQITELEALLTPRPILSLAERTEKKAAIIEAQQKLLTQLMRKMPLENGAKRLARTVSEREVQLVGVVGLEGLKKNIGDRFRSHMSLLGTNRPKSLAPAQKIETRKIFAERASVPLEIKPKDISPSSEGPLFKYPVNSIKSLAVSTKHVKQKSDNTNGSSGVKITIGHVRQKSEKDYTRQKSSASIFSETPSFNEKKILGVRTKSGASFRSSRSNTIEKGANHSVRSSINRTPSRKQSYSENSASGSSRKQSYNDKFKSHVKESSSGNERKSVMKPESVVSIEGRDSMIDTTHDREAHPKETLLLYPRRSINAPTLEVGSSNSVLLADIAIQATADRKNTVPSSPCTDLASSHANMSPISPRPTNSPILPSLSKLINAKNARPLSFRGTGERSSIVGMMTRSGSKGSLKKNSDYKIQTSPSLNILDKPSNNNGGAGHRAIDGEASMSQKSVASLGISRLKSDISAQNSKGSGLDDKEDSKILDKNETPPERYESISDFISVKDIQDLPVLPSPEELELFDDKSSPEEYEHAPPEINFIERKASIREQATNDYHEYLLLQQRHDSVNFIHKIGSEDLVYEKQALRVKYLGNNLLGGQVGKGAFGKVKEGICTESLQRVAVKVISKKKVKIMVDGVIREIILLQRLKHINVVKLVDVFAKVEDDEGKTAIFPWFLTIEQEPIVWLFENGEEEEKRVSILKWYIIMEFCPCSLQTILDYAPDHKISMQDSHSYFTQLIHGLEYLHSQKVIHRDIKPGNLLVSTDGIVKITDFGITEQFDPYSESDMNCSMFAGTHQFLSPEVLTDESEIVDIWACGIVLYNIISGYFPFEFDEEPNILDLHEKIIKAEYDMPEEASFPLDTLIRGILTKNAAERFTIEQILTHPWVLSQTPTIKMNEILPNHHSKDKLDGEITVIPCETTMLPYISQIYMDELENDIKLCGTIHKYDAFEDPDAVELGSKENLRSVGRMIGSLDWIKKHVSIKKSK